MTPGGGGGQQGVTMDQLGAPGTSCWGPPTPSLGPTPGPWRTGAADTAACLSTSPWLSWCHLVWTPMSEVRLDSCVFLSIKWNGLRVSLHCKQYNFTVQCHCIRALGLQCCNVASCITMIYFLPPQWCRDNTGNI